MHRRKCESGVREARERRNQLRHPAYAKPELLATGPNQVWTWDVDVLGLLRWQKLRQLPSQSGTPLAPSEHMKPDPIRGKTLRWTFTDGPMAKKAFEHSFDKNGSVSFRSIDGAAKGEPTEIKKYEVAPVSARVCAISYLSSGYTLTVVLDFETGKLFAFSSNEKEMALQHGTFEEVSEKSGKHSRKTKGARESTARS